MTEKIFTARQLVLMSLIGGPIGGVYALSNNVAAADPANPSLTLALAACGWAPACVYAIALPYLPIAMSVVVVPIIFCVVICFVAAECDTERRLVQIGCDYAYYGDLETAVLCLSALMLFVSIELAWFFVLREFVRV